VNYYLIYSPNTPKEQKYSLEFGLNTIGRDISNSISIVEPCLSRHHAEIFIDKNHITLRDLNSTNGTFINGIKIKQGNLASGDWIKCGTIVFEFLEILDNHNLPPLNEPESQQLIFKQFSFDNLRVAIQDLLEPESPPNSVLMIREQEPHQRTVDKLRVLLEISKQLCSPEEPEQLFQKVLEQLLKIMNVDRAVILIVNEESGELEQKAIKIKSETSVDTRFYSTRITNLVRTTGDAVLTADAEKDTRFNEALSVLDQSIHASMCVPLKPYDEVIGVLYVDSLSSRAVYSEEDLEFLTALANQAAAAIHMAREFYKREQQLKQQVIELKIQIDQAKKEQQVEEIVESDSFKKLQERARKIRERR
jgi:adenylate cyclase